MKPAALSITVTLEAPGMGWGYVARKRGEVVAASDGETFDHPGRALAAAIADVKSSLPTPEPEEGGEDE